MSHEYQVEFPDPFVRRRIADCFDQMVFHEVLDFSTNQIMLRTGAPYNETYVESEHKTLRLEGRQTTRELLFSTPFEDGIWHNFAVTINWESESVSH